MEVGGDISAEGQYYMGRGDMGGGIWEGGVRGVLYASRGGRRTTCSLLCGDPRDWHDHQRLHVSHRVVGLLFYVTTVNHKPNNIHR